MYLKNLEFDPCTLKDTITIQLVNTERCRHYLLDKAHTEVEDLSIIYRLNADFGGGNNGSSVITTKMMEMMGMNEKELDPKEFLSDNVYHYDHKEKIFSKKKSGYW